MDINLFDFTASKDDVTPSQQVKQRGRKKRHADGQQETTGDATEILDPPKNKSKRAVLHTVAPSATEDDVKLQKSPQRAGQLREKLLRLAPSTKQQNTLIVDKDKQADSQPSVPTLNVEPATDSENDEGVDERGGDEMQIHSQGDNKPNSELEADADRNAEKEEVLLPDITGGSGTPVRDSQNSKYDKHCLTACKSSS